MIYYLTKTQYQTQFIPKHYKIYNISYEPINGIEFIKELQFTKIVNLKLKKGTISNSELEEAYFRNLDARGQHLINTDYNNNILICDCEGEEHKENCPTTLLIKYMALKNLNMEKYI